MQDYTTIFYECKDKIATVWLNRPGIRNAFNEVMISELTNCFKELNKEKDVRAVLLRGKGKCFCAGADLNWMRDVTKYSYEENYQESYRLSQCFYSIYTCKKPTIALVHGAAIGGANGLLAACDMAYCDDETIFSLSEVKIGVVPACISPYILKRVGEFAARELMLTGKRIRGKEAERLRLVNQSLPQKDLSDAYQHSQRADLFVVVGSSLVVTPAAHMPQVALQSGARLVIINQGETPFDRVVHLRFEEGTGEVLTAAVARLKELMKRSPH